ncbi:hypothetical protein A3Q56_05254 [Intoshia linei]|uniref:leucine--tRNA ligase n=1 Tax=Intoshia linei TaxID=1819745 RepID=A0A177AYB3_9BILA|nr:hypothetical protein A3Q56_05254 [Intoshia linei]
MTLIFVKRKLYSASGKWPTEYTQTVRKELETFWKNKSTLKKEINLKKTQKKFYCLAMFPYPSGKLHLGHMRVYTISDAMSKYYKMNNYDTFHPIGWDSFGLPAENAAIENNLSPKKWTDQNIKLMKSQMQGLSIDFDWQSELSTSDPEYFKWTQYLFLKLHQHNYAYQNKSLVNWDPIDKTVLADEQIDLKGRGWRSGAKVQLKYMKQWFIKTSDFSEKLYNGLDSADTRLWKNVVEIQKNWIGKPDGVDISFKIYSKVDNDSSFVTTLKIFTKYPHLIHGVSYLSVNCNHWLSSLIDSKNIFAVNPLTQSHIPIIINQHDKLTNTKISHNSLHIPSKDPQDCAYAEKNNLSYIDFPYNELPLIRGENEQEWKKAKCTKCDCNEYGTRELDTMDTFVDSSWYFFRYLDNKNKDQIFSKKIADKMMPIDLYIGGTEHGNILFVCYFLNEIGFTSVKEPFKSLITQGMIKGQTLKRIRDGAYLKKENVYQIMEKNGKQFYEKFSNDKVEQIYEKMSKSKYNGTDPMEVVQKYGIEATRLCILSNVAPKSERLWNEDVFTGVLRWQVKVWRLVSNRYDLRNKINTTPDSNLEFMDQLIKTKRNLLIKDINVLISELFLINSAISSLHIATNFLKKIPDNIIIHSKNYDTFLKDLIIFIYPFSPMFACELWKGFTSIENKNAHDYKKNVFDESWPVVDNCYQELIVIFLDKKVVNEILAPKEKISNSEDMIDYFSNCHYFKNEIKRIKDYNIKCTIKPNSSMYRLYLKKIETSQSKNIKNVM